MRTSCCHLSQHLLVLGGGSAGFAAAIRARELGAEVTVVNDGLPWGGTCVNVGCVPSKTLLRAAEALHRAQQLPFAGMASEARLLDFAALIRQKRELVATLRQEKYEEVAAAHGIQRLVGRARFVGPRQVEVNGQRLEADAVVIATGARPAAPPIDGLQEVGFLTNEDVMELEELPPRLLVLGGNAVGLEQAQLFARLGSQVTVVEIAPHVLPREDAAVAAELVRHLQAEGIQVLEGAATLGVRREKDEVQLDIQQGERRFTVSCTHLLVATGRRANTEGLGLEAAGVATDSRGFVVADATLATTAPGVWAAGDVIGEPMLVYTAAAQGALAAENALAGAARAFDRSLVPWVVFTDPQVAGVGLDQEQARAAGFQAETVTVPLKLVPRALAARDTRGFVSLVRDRASDRLLGARIVAPEGGELLMELALAIRCGLTTKQLASELHPYLTLSEAVKLACLAFARDVRTLSCCAS